MAKPAQSSTKRPSRSRYKKTSIGTGRNSRQDKQYQGQGK